MFNWGFTRGDWQDPAVPVVGPVMNRSRVDKVVVHYTAAQKIPSDVPKYLRDMQNYYVNQRGYSLGYNAAVTQSGDVYQVRGFDFRCAANSEVNVSSFAVLVLVDGDDAASPLAVAAVRRLVDAVQVWCGRKVDVVGHGEVGSTSCPGVGLKQQVADGVFYPSVVGVDGMFVLDYQPGSAGWVRLTWDGIGRVAHVRSGHVAAVYEAAGLKPVVVSKVQLDALLREPASEKLGENPFVSGPSADPQLAAAWRV